MELNQEQLQHFTKEGFLLVHDVLADIDLDPVIQEYEEHIDRRARELLGQGKLSQLYQDQSFEHRLVCICRENNEIYPELDIMHLRGKASFGFLRNKKLMAIVASIVGPEVTCSPIQHIRAKLPMGLTPGGADAHVAPWHQDAGVTWNDADPYFILTVWIPLVEATEENGCLQIIPRVHGRGLLEHHSKVGVGTTIIDEEMPSHGVLNLPMKKGSVLLMHKEIPHRSTPNQSDAVRWSMDLRYQQTGTPTGRPFHPSFVVYSQSNPSSVLEDHETWSKMWGQALENSVGIQPHRWSQKS